MITVILPTRNRPEYLAESLASVLAQEVEGMVVEVHDNASGPATSDVIRSSSDERVSHIRHEENVGLFRNWLWALDGVETPYVALLQDDDLWRPTFLRRAVAALETSPEVGLVFADVELIDGDGLPVGVRVTALPEGRFPGTEYLHRVVSGENLIIDMSTAVMRTDALRTAGSLDITHQTHDIAFNLQFRIAATWDFVRLPTKLTKVRLHEGQAHRGELSSGAAVGMVSERMDAAAFLVGSPRASDPAYRQWLANRLVSLSRLRSQYTADVLPSQIAPYEERLALAVEDLHRLVPQGATLALVGDELLYDSRLEGWTVTAFGEGPGAPGGSPVDGEAAIAEVERSRDQGAQFLVFPWPAFWWLDFYGDLREFLADSPVVVDNSRLVVYDLRS